MAKTYDGRIEKLDDYRWQIPVDPNQGMNVRTTWATGARSNGSQQDHPQAPMSRAIDTKMSHTSAIISNTTTRDSQRSSTMNHPTQQLRSSSES